MSFIGNYVPTVASSQDLFPDLQFFNGNGTTTTFQLNRQVRSAASMLVTINNVIQAPIDAYSINASNQIVFTGAPTTGTNNICVIHQPFFNTIGTPPVNSVGSINLSRNSVDSDRIANGSITREKLDVASSTGTGALDLPRGSTAQRPTSAQTGMIRYNNSTNFVEFFGNSAWTSFGNLAFLNAVGTAQIQNWSQLNSSNGYVTFPGGLILQWCTGGSLASETSIFVTFPIPFPNQCLNVMLGTQMPAGDRDSMFQLLSFTRFGASCQLNSFAGAGGTGQPLVWAVGN